MQSLAAAKIGRADADKKHNQKDKKEDFTASSRDDMYVYMLKLSAVFWTNQSLNKKELAKLERKKISIMCLIRTPFSIPHSAT